MFVVRRSENNPFIIPHKERPWEAKATFNWCPVQDGDTTHCLYRAMTEPDVLKGPNYSLSTVGYTYTTDGENYAEPRPLIVPEYEWERFGCEDPRVTKIDDTYYIFYTALSQFPFGPDGIKVAVATTKDFKTIDRKELVTPFNSKAMAMFPEKINGKYTVILTADSDIPPAKIALATFDSIEDLWNADKWSTWYGKLDEYSLPLQLKHDDHIEVGAAPVKTDDGWLVVYAHIQNYLSDHKIFGIEAFLLDLNDPTIIRGRTHGPLLVPETNYELYGMIPNVIFPSGALINGDQLDIYYGAADNTCCRASVNLNDLIKRMKPETRYTHIARAADNPVLKPIPENDWEAKLVFNPTAIDLDGRVHMVYRAMSHDNTSTMGYASSADGMHFDERLSDPIYVPRADFEMKKNQPDGNSGCEDGRLTKIDDRIYMCYTAYNGIEVPHVAMSSISEADFLAHNWNWTDPVIITPQGIDDKDACVFPEKINGKYMIIHRVDHHVCADLVDSLDFVNEKVDSCIRVLGPRPGMWDGKKVGIAGPPMRVDEGWLLLYHGVSDDGFYRIGAVLLDEKDPTITLARTTDYIFEPREEYELVGEIPNVVFPCGSVIRDDTLYIYYGGADAVIGIATMSVSDLMAKLLK